MNNIRFLRPIILGACFLILTLICNAGARAAVVIQPQQCDFATQQCNNTNSVNAPYVPVKGVITGGPANNNSVAGCVGPFCGAEADTLTAASPIDAFQSCIYVDHPNGNIYIPFGNVHDWASFLTAANTGLHPVASLVPCVRPYPAAVALKPDATCVNPKLISSPWKNADGSFSNNMPTVYGRPGLLPNVPTIEYQCGYDTAPYSYQFVTWDVSGSVDVTTTDLAGQQKGSNANSIPYGRIVLATGNDNWSAGPGSTCFQQTVPSNSTGSSPTIKTTPCTLQAAPVVVVVAPTITLTATDITVSPQTSVSATDNTQTLTINDGDQVNLSWAVDKSTASMVCSTSGNWTDIQYKTAQKSSLIVTPPSFGASYTLTCSNGSKYTSSATIVIKVKTDVCALVNPVVLSPPYQPISGSGTDYMLASGSAIAVSGFGHAISAMGSGYSIALSGSSNCISATGSDNIFSISGGADVTINVTGGSGTLIVMSGSGGTIRVNGNPADYTLVPGGNNTVIINGVPAS